jgi:hypothetical protein
VDTPLPQLVLSCEVAYSCIKLTNLHILNFLCGTLQMMSCVLVTVNHCLAAVQQQWRVRRVITTRSCITHRLS